MLVGFASLYPPHPMVLLSSIFKHFFEELGMIHAESVTFLLTCLFLFHVSFVPCVAIHENPSIATKGTQSTKKIGCGYVALCVSWSNKSINPSPLCVPLRTSAISAFIFFSSCFVSSVCFVVNRILSALPVTSVYPTSQTTTAKNMKTALESML